jgi:CheY-like chemotaxis protein
VQDSWHPRLLVADDSVTVQKVIELTFFDSPIVVEHVGDGTSAHDSIAAQAPDMLIADVHMPGLSGYEIAAFAKSVDPSLPVLLLVGAFEPFDEAAFERCQADAALEKPFDSEELYEAVTTLLRGEGLTPPFRFSDRRILKSPLARTTAHAPATRLAVFLCHATQDKQEVRSLAQRLRKSGFDPWLDEERLLPGQQWELEITRALRSSNAILVCLSQRAVSNTGYVQKEIAFALDLLSHQPEDPSTSYRCC